MTDFLNQLLASATPKSWGFGVYIVAVLAIVCLMIGISYVLGGRDTGRAKNEPFESGVVSPGSANLRISAKFYLVAMFFVVFDLEAVYLYAWSVSVREVGWGGFVEAFIFIAVLLIGLFYVWRLGGLEWAPKPRLQRGPRLLPTADRPAGLGD